MSRPITNPTPSYGTTTGPDPLSLLDGSFSTVYGGVNDSSNGFVNYALDIGTANNYQVTIAPVASGYAPGMTVAFVALNANTGGSTLTVGTLGSIAINDIQGNPLRAGAIAAGQIVVVVYTGAVFMLTYRYPLNISTTFGGVSNVSASGVSSLSVNSTISATTTITIGAAVPGIPMMFLVQNVSGATQAIAIQGAAPFNAFSNARYVTQASVATATNMQTTSILIPNGAVLILQGIVTATSLNWTGVIA
jgi:hypothetical protein